jgi:hypothetical protein
MIALYAVHIQYTDMVHVPYFPASNTRKGFEECVREETAHLTTLKSKSIYVS